MAPTATQTAAPDEAPSIAEPTATAPRADQTDVERRIDDVFARQQAHRWEMASSTARERRERLRRIVRWVEGHTKEIRQAGYDDFRKPATEVDLTEIFPVLQEAKHAIKDLGKWMKPRRVRPSLALASTRSKIHHEAKGVSLIISPWNYPFNLTICPLISAIAAGCTAMLKPSEMTPAMGALLRGMVEELFPEEEVALFEGEADVAQALLAKPFDHVFFTGSPQIGKVVMKAAAEHLTTVTLELGGKSPVVVDESAHVVDAAQKTVWGKWVNQGQTCIAPDYVLVHRSRHDELVEEMGRQIAKYYGKSEEKRKASKDLARVVNRRHFGRLKSLLDDSVDQGARVAFGGATDEDDCWIEPTLLVDVPLDAPAMQEEIFGPLLPVVPFDDLRDAVDLIRAKEKPLALYLFSRDSSATDEILRGTSAGGTCVNDVALHFLHKNLPFGGINHSGHGSSHGIYGFRAFSHERPVLRHSRFSALKLMAPPYGALSKLLTKLTVKYLS